jgi:Holliday junction resolvase
VGKSIFKFTVLGIPAPQGSKNQFGGESSPHVKVWRATVAEEAKTLVPDGPISGPVQVSVAFVFPRPKSHYGTGRNSGKLKEWAPYWHVSVPDLDKLQRAIGDALKGTVLSDDSQIAAWSVQKFYGRKPQARIEIVEIGV